MLDPSRGAPPIYKNRHTFKLVFVNLRCCRITLVLRKRCSVTRLHFRIVPEAGDGNDTATVEARYVDVEAS